MGHGAKVPALIQRGTKSTWLRSFLAHLVWSQVTWCWIKNQAPTAEVTGYDFKPSHSHKCSLSSGLHGCRPHQANETKSIFVPIKLNNSRELYLNGPFQHVLILFSGILCFFSKLSQGCRKKLVWEYQDEGMYICRWSTVDSQCHLVVAWLREVTSLGVNKGFKRAKINTKKTKTKDRKVAQASHDCQALASVDQHQLKSQLLQLFTDYNNRHLNEENNRKVNKREKNWVFNMEVHNSY